MSELQETPKSDKGSKKKKGIKYENSIAFIKEYIVFLEKLGVERKTIVGITGYTSISLGLPFIGPLSAIPHIVLRFPWFLAALEVFISNRIRKKEADKKSVNEIGKSIEFINQEKIEVEDKNQDQLSNSNIIDALSSQVQDLISPITGVGFIPVSIYNRFSINKEEYGKIFREKVQSKIDAKRDEPGFKVYLNKLIAEKDEIPAEVMRKSGIEKGYFYEILRNSNNKQPTRDKVIRIALALNLNSQEANDLLAHLGYTIYGPYKRDCIIFDCICNGRSVIDTNIELEEHTEVPLS